MSERTQRETEIIDTYLAGASLRAVAQSFNTNPENVRRLLQRHGIDRRPAAPTATSTAGMIGWFNPKALTQLRRRQGLTRHQLADKAGISVRTLERHENLADRVQPPLKTLHRLADALQADPTELMRGARNLRWTRIAAGLNPSELAHAIGVSRQQLSKIERNKAPFPEHKIIQAADALNVADTVLRRRLSFNE